MISALYYNKTLSYIFLDDELCFVLEQDAELHLYGASSPTQ